MRLIVGLIAVMVMMWIAKLFTGEGSRRVPRDERQKQIFRDATATSWQIMIFYSFLKLVSILPWFNHLIYMQDTVFLANTFYTHGGDVLILGGVGYVVGYVGSHIKHS